MPSIFSKHLFHTRNYETTKQKGAGLQFFGSYMLAFVTISDTQIILHSNLVSNMNINRLVFSSSQIHFMSMGNWDQIVHASNGKQTQ